MITFRSVTKRFGEGTPALEDVSFHVEPGEFIFLTGHSGSGKTTLLKLLTKEYAPSQGEIEFQGNLLNKMRGSQVHKHRRSIGVVFQDYRLLPDLNVWENIALALQIIGKPQREIEERVTDLLELVQLTDKAYHFPAQLSGGESQRIGIARALATAPSILLADEPTGNLDPQTTLMIAKLFDRINQLGTTVLFATHDTGVLGALSHRRLILEKGKIISDSGAKSQPKASSSQPKDTPKTAVKAPAKPEIKAEAAPNPEPTPKKSGFKFPKFSLPFGKSKKAKEETPMTEVTPTEVAPKSPPPQEEKPAPVTQIKQESLDDDDETEKSEKPKKTHTEKTEKPKKQTKEKDKS
jgi:cell division transport system ATP-binding protein